MNTSLFCALAVRASLFYLPLRHLPDGDHRWVFPTVRRKPACSSCGDLPEAERRRVPRSGVAVRKVDKRDTYTLAAERDMTLAGFAAFLDPPKEGVLPVLEELEKNGVSVVIMTGDNQSVTQKIAHDVGLVRPG